jgi:peptidoglycan/LPS O-acetylase OafA/YrhL
MKTTLLTANEAIPRLNAVRLLVVMALAFGYASTMSLSPQSMETGTHLGYEPSWLAIQVLFFFSGALAARSLAGGRGGMAYLKSRFWRVIPLLFAVTLATVLVIYPLVGKPLTTPVQTLKTLASYFFLTVSCFDPGRPLPGLLDNAVYMCIIQGAAWTLRWGVICHLLVFTFMRFEVLRRPRVLMILSLAATALYAVLVYCAVKMEITALNKALIGLRLGYVFLIGMAVWANQDRLPRAPKTQIALVSAFGLVAVSNYFIAPWTPLIEISLTFFWGYAAWLAATSRTPKLAILSGWPHLAIGMLLLNWPASQLLLNAYPQLGRWSLPAIALPLTLALSVLTYLALTGRIERRISRKLDREVPVKAARP